jgi:glycosyltransferase involved in cell wall biosynthesis
MADRKPRVALLSLDPWDDVWRRNQWLATELVDSGAIGSLLFVTPPEPGLAPRARRRRPRPDVLVVTPPLVVPRRYGGHRAIGWWLRRKLDAVDVLWVNDPVAGAAVLRAGVRTVYDVTDDWRSMPQRASSRARTVAVENLLAQRADVTVVCSQVLAERWRARYGVQPVLVPNGVDVDGMRCAQPRSLPGDAPHAVYVGTAHPNRVDFDLVVQLARTRKATVHLIGPGHIGPALRQRLDAAGVQLHGPVPSDEVPSWLVSADVLICPHLVDAFTLSLDAIKAHEYLATDRPVVATASSGFQSLAAAGLTVAGADQFVDAVLAAAGTGPYSRPAPPSWAERAALFAEALVPSTRSAR